MAQAESSVDALIDRVSSSKYQIRRVIGAGGMGAVFEAEHIFTKRVGALKLLHEEYARMPEVVERFTREASAAGRIANPHIVETYDAGRLESGQPYMFMELLSGQPFDDVLRERGSLSFELAIRVVIQAATGLAAAHQAGIIHRDIKPANLFVVDGDALLVKLLDFGISKFNVAEGVSQVTQEGTMLGTPQYMAPEQVMGRADVDERVDVYALGVVLYEAVVGHPPFVEPTIGALAVRICEGRHARVSEFRPDAPPGLDQVIENCLVVDRERRYRSMGPLIEDLRLLVDSHAQLSRAPTMAVPSAAPPGLGVPALSTVSGGRIAASTSVTSEPRATPRSLWVLVGAGALALAAAAYWFGPFRESEAPAATTSAAPSAPEPAASAEAPAEPAAVVTPVPSAVPNVAPVASPEPSVPKPAKVPIKPRAPAAPKEGDGLERENPFD